MKHILLPMAAGFACAAMLASCGKDEDKSLQFDTYSASAVYSLDGTADDFGMDSDVVIADSVSLILPTRLGTADITALRDTILMQALGSKVAPVDSAMAVWFRNNVTESGYKSTPSTASPTTADGYNRVEGFIVCLTPRTLAYCIQTAQYTPGAANGFASRQYINYTMLDGGHIVNLSDVFTADGIKALPRLIADQAQGMSQYADRVDIVDLPEGNNFYFSSEGEIVFSYYPTEVGAHSLGQVEVPFYPYELVTYLTPRAVQLFGLTDIE